jgi:predicted nucleic acid-binding protein
MYLLDTDTCVYWLNGRISIRERLFAAGWDQVATRHYERIPDLRLENWLTAE